MVSLLINHEALCKQEMEAFPFEIAKYMAKG